MADPVRFAESLLAQRAFAIIRACALRCALLIFAALRRAIAAAHVLRFVSMAGI